MNAPLYTTKKTLFYTRDPLLSHLGSKEELCRLPLRKQLQKTIL